MNTSRSCEASPGYFATARRNEDRPCSGARLRFVYQMLGEVSPRKIEGAGTNTFSEMHNLNPTGSM